jgi:hypothetical protein
LASPLQPGDHYILRKLCDELLPWMLCGRSVGRQWFVVLATVHGYGSELAAAIAGLGIGTPVVAMFEGKAPQGSNAIDVLRSNFSGWLFYAGIAALAIWLVARVVMKQQNVAARAVLAQEFAKGIKALHAQLFQVLPATDPMPQIIAIQKTVDDKVQDAIKNEIWPYDPPLPPPTLTDLPLKETVNDIRLRFMAKWAPPPPGVR